MTEYQATGWDEEQGKKSRLSHYEALQSRFKTPDSKGKEKHD